MKSKLPSSAETTLGLLTFFAGGLFVIACGFILQTLSGILIPFFCSAFSSLSCRTPPETSDPLPFPNRSKSSPSLTQHCLDSVSCRAVGLQQRQCVNSQLASLSDANTRDALRCSRCPQHPSFSDPRATNRNSVGGSYQCRSDCTNFRARIGELCRVPHKPVFSTALSGVSTFRTGEFYSKVGKFLFPSQRSLQSSCGDSFHQSANCQLLEH